MHPAFHYLWAKKATNGLAWLPLYIHLEDTVAISNRLWENWLSDGAKRVISELCNASEEKTRQLYIFLSACHDIGKATPVFQSKTTQYQSTDLDRTIEENIRTQGLSMMGKDWFRNGNRTPHALAGLFILERNNIDRRISSIVSAHHGKPADNANLADTMGAFKENFYGDCQEADWKRLQDDFLEFAFSKANLSGPEELPLPSSPGQVLLSALLVISDWISSNETLFPYISPDISPLAVGQYINLSERCSFAWEKLSFPPLWAPGNSYSQDDYYSSRFGDESHDFEPNHLQQAVYRIASELDEPGLMIIESTMGSGKTEAALAAAEIFAAKSGRTGVFFALPTQATSNSMFSRFIDWLDRIDHWTHEVKLAHGKARFNEIVQSLEIIDGEHQIFENEGTGTHTSVVHQWFEGQKKSLLASFVVGTVDQILLAGLKQKHVMLRHLGLTNKIVIIDECHAYDTYMNQYLLKAISWLAAYRVPVIILSATLPYQKKKEFLNSYRKGWGHKAFHLKEGIRSYPLVTYTDRDEVSESSIEIPQTGRVVRIERIEDTEISSVLTNYLSQGGVAGIIVNTVARAQNLYSQLSQDYGEDVVTLLHSRFTAYDRIKKEDRLISELGRKTDNRPALRIVIGTQILEQSLDIDFDLLITDLCPMDLLLQRIGRLHRHERVRPQLLKDAHCQVVSPKEGFEKGSAQIYSEYLLARTSSALPLTVSIPENIPSLVESVYDETSMPDNDPNYWKEVYEEWKTTIESSRIRSKAFQIADPRVRLHYPFTSWLETDQGNTEHQGRAAVRDSAESLEVIVLYENDLGEIHTVPWTDPDIRINPKQVPEIEAATMIATQTVSLPRQLCVPWEINHTIRYLEEQSVNLPMLQESHLLKGELFLVLDRDFRGNINDHPVRYSQTLGLLIEEQPEC